MENNLSQKEVLAKQLKQALTVTAIQTCELAPGESYTFYGREGRNYRVVATNIDDSYTAETEIYDKDWGHLAGKLTLEPFQAGSVAVVMAKQNGVRVYNTSKEPTSGRPKISYSLYNA